MKNDIKHYNFTGAWKCYINGIGYYRTKYVIAFMLLSWAIGVMTGGAL